MENSLIEKSLHEIESLNQRRQFNIAEIRAKKLISELKLKAPNNTDQLINANLLLAESLSRSAKNLLAIDLLEKLNSRFPYEEKILLALLELYTKLKRNINIEKTIRAIIYSNPDNTSNYLKLIDIFSKNPDKLMLVIELEKMIADGIIQTSVYRLLASALDEEKLFTDKLRVLEMLQKLDPSDISVIREEVKSLFSLHDYYQAFQIMDALIVRLFEKGEYSTELSETLSEYGNFYLKLGYADTLSEYIIRLFLIYNTSSLPMKQKLEKLAKDYNLEICFNFIVLPELFSIQPVANLHLKLKPEKPDIDIIINNFHLIRVKCDYDKSKYSLKSFFYRFGLNRLLPPELCYPLVFYLEND